jgi:hypothetical protein
VKFKKQGGCGHSNGAKGGSEMTGGGGGGKALKNTDYPLDLSKSKQGARQRAVPISSGPNSSREALLKYVQRHGYYVYCTFMSLALIIFGSWIRIRIRVKSWIRIRI